MLSPNSLTQAIPPRRALYSRWTSSLPDNARAQRAGHAAGSSRGLRGRRSRPPRQRPFPRVHLTARLPPMVDLTRTFSLGPDVPRWSPATWDDIVAAAAAGLLNETHWVELKRAVSPTSEEGSLELARDLASLALDGGLLIVGIKDNGGKAGEVVGTSELEALRDRVDQVARTRVHPPLLVSITTFPHPTELDTGCLVVSVPPSPDAPHMVDKHYWGRGDASKRKLDDHEVERYMVERRLRVTQITAVLREWVEARPGARMQRPMGGPMSWCHRGQDGVISSRSCWIVATGRCRRLSRQQPTRCPCSPSRRVSARPRGTTATRGRSSTELTGRTKVRTSSSSTFTRKLVSGSCREASRVIEPKVG
ncbi:Putative DNA-binding domain-containing protein [Jiangella alkaliphila]|uniref:Putative DNA-binding domain-containing protein n=1 Tax=Jiangella alkaliphila TaxID=419479 RepID=A0A1H2L8H0_9ACTN|nr:Putative DNA-binding domain-containing protein [Jiangella alkaliphila]